MKIYVGNLSYVVTEDDLEHLFVAYGKVDSVSIVPDKMSGLPSGFVEMPDETEARTDIRNIDGIEMIGHTINLRIRDKKSERRIESGRRLTDERRELMDRRAPLDRRIYLEEITFDDRRVQPNRRSFDDRRSLDRRDISDDRRNLANRRISA